MFRLAMYALSADIGGTNSRIQLMENSRDAGSVVYSARYRNRGYDDLQSVIRQFLQESALRKPIDYACIAVAGPVIDGAVKITNLPWAVTERSISREFKIPTVRLVNDLVAAAYGIDFLGDEDMLTLQRGVARKSYPAVILGVGTGFGQAMMVRTGRGPQLFPSEAGHGDFAPRNQLSAELLSYLWQKRMDVSIETLLSGVGLERTFDFHLERSADYAGRSVSAAGIIELAKQGDEVAVAALSQFIDNLGAQAGNAALCYLAASGVYLVGGVISGLIDSLVNGPFLEAFNSKGKMAFLTESIPVKAILNENLGLLGAAAIVQNDFITDC